MGVLHFSCIISHFGSMFNGYGSDEGDGCIGETHHVEEA